MTWYDEIGLMEMHRYRHDLQEAPVLEYCSVCGEEIYDIDAAEYDDESATWICDDCRRALVLTEEYEKENGTWEED